MNANMNRTPAHTITIPDDVRSVAVETWADGLEWFGIIWDRTGEEADNGEWGNEMIRWTGDRADAERMVEQAGFEIGEFESIDLGDGPEDFATAKRA